MLFSLTLAGALHPALGLSVSATAETAAAVWLRAHRGAPQPDELAELKDANPEAYGLVKALLMKRSLGLLDPRHPTASFAKTPAATTEDASSGPEAFAKIAAESGEKPKAPMMYPDAPVVPVHHDWMTWKPQQSALDDASMVNDVIGAAPAKAESDSSQEAPASASSQAVQAAQAPAEAAAPAEAKPVASMNQENSYLKGIDFGLGAPQQPQPRESIEQNSYLKQVDLGGEPTQTQPRAIGLSSMSRSQSSQSSQNLLSSFSWDDAAPTAKATTAAPAAAKKPVNALLNWLSPKVQQRAAPTQPPAAVQQEQNSYLKNLDLTSD